MRDRQPLPWGSKRVQHAVQVKAGACRGERVARGDRLPRIEEELGDGALRRLRFSKGERGRAGKEARFLRRGEGGVRQERSAGGVVFRAEAGDVEILLILDRFGRWTFPKGHVEGHETEEEAALREIEEETGVTGTVVRKLPTVRYRFHNPDDPEAEAVEKEVHYFLVRAEAGEPRRLPGETISVRWFRPADAEVLLQYEQNRAILEAARAALEGTAEPGRGNGGR